MPSSAVSASPPVAARGGEWIIAVALLAASVLGVWKLPQAGVAEWERHALDVVRAVQSQRIALGREGSEPLPLLAWLHSEQAPAPTTLPGTLAQQKAMGARHWERQGRRYSLLALEIEGASTATLLATSAAGLAGEPAGEQPRVARIGEWTFVSWREAAVECRLLTEAPVAEIRALFDRPSELSGAK